MKNKKLEERIENIKLASRAVILLPYLVGRVALAILGEEIKGKYYKTFKIPHAIYDDGEFLNYIRLDKIVSQE
ncbi:MAG: hypothetical protein ACP5NZ_05080 [Nanobdellota archaeon]